MSTSLVPTGIRRKFEVAERHPASAMLRFGTVLADPPWQFNNRTGKMAPEHKRLHRYRTMSVPEISSLPVRDVVADQAHLYLWVPNALLAEGLEVMKAWGFTYKTNIVWYKVRKDGGPDGRGVGFYFRNVTELLLFGIRGRLRTLQPGRTAVNLLMSRKQEHSVKPEHAYDLLEKCSPGPYLELFARKAREGWVQWGDEAEHGGDLLHLARSMRVLERATRF
jgi:N6-adenosine-specific RNA methylase IME4